MSAFLVANMAPLMFATLVAFLLLPEMYLFDSRDHGMGPWAALVCGTFAYVFTLAFVIRLVVVCAGKCRADSGKPR